MQYQTYTQNIATFAEWSKDNLLEEEMKLTIADLRKGNVQALKDLADFLSIASRRGGKVFSDNVLSSLGDALEKEIF